MTIIGVVAALTIPTLMAKHQNQQYAVGLKKIYSTLSNVIQMIPITEGCSAGDFDCAGMFEQQSKATNIDGQDFGGDIAKKQLYLLSKNLKVEKLYLDGNSPLWGSYVYAANTPSLITEDGIGIGISESNGDILVDVNGIKGPNKPGKDVFGFGVTTAQNKVVKLHPLGPTLDSSSVCKIDGFSDNDYWYPNSTGGFACTEQVLRDGKIDY